MLRTAAGRRALQLVLFVGGLFVLGFLCGEQAHAAEGAPVLPVTALRPVVHVPLDAGSGAVTGRVTIPVRDVVRTASRALEETRAGVPALRALPTDPTVPLPTTPLPTLPPLRPLPTLPTMPTTRLPTLPQLPPPPATPVPAPRPPTAPLPRLPEGSGPPAQPLPTPAGPESRPHRNGGTAQAGGPDHRVRTAARTALGARPSATAYGPPVARVTARAAEAPARAAAHRAVTPAAPPAGAPVPPRPTGDPDGVLGKQAADAPAPRHSGDRCAVAPGGRAPLRLLPAGTLARTEVPRTRERHRDIPVFPG
ncbi:hypothetical protein [Streptomyces sp. IBSBF 3136]|uniref:hypothetical protein n=1 Tax=Streptomyces sp. IBSBF 3136 TaxID=2903524 RepID=UPI002FDC0311